MLDSVNASTLERGSINLPLHWMRAFLVHVVPSMLAGRIDQRGGERHLREHECTQGRTWLARPCPLQMDQFLEQGTGIYKSAHSSL